MRLSFLLSFLIFWSGLGVSLNNEARGMNVPDTIASSAVVYSDDNSNRDAPKLLSIQDISNHGHTIVGSRDIPQPHSSSRIRDIGFSDLPLLLVERTGHSDPDVESFVATAISYTSSIKWLLYPKHSFW